MRKTGGGERHQRGHVEAFRPRWQRPPREHEPGDDLQIGGVTVSPLVGCYLGGLLAGHVRAQFGFGIVNELSADVNGHLGFRLGKRDDHQLTCYVNRFWVTFTTHHNGELGSGPTLYLKVDDIDDFYGAVLAHGFTPPAEPRKDRPDAGSSS